MARPVPETGQFELVVVDFSAWKRAATHPASEMGEQIGPNEAAQLLTITTRMATLSTRIIRSVTFVIRCLTGGRGMDSVAVRRQWEERQAELIYLDEYRDLEPNGPRAA